MDPSRRLQMDPRLLLLVELRIEPMLLTMELKTDPRWLRIEMGLRIQKRKPKVSAVTSIDSIEVLHQIERHSLIQYFSYYVLP